MQTAIKQTVKRQLEKQTEEKRESSRGEARRERRGERGCLWGGGRVLERLAIARARGNGRG